MKLFHIHKSNDYDNLYVEGNTFEVGNKINTLRRATLNRDLAYLDYIERKDGVLIDHYANIEKLMDIEKISQMSDENKIKLVDRLKEIIHNSNIDFRELILEEVRLRCFNDRPTRYKCMWLTDEESLPFWLDTLKDIEGLKTYELEVDGNIFVSTNSLLPDGYITKDLLYRRALEYWNPKEEDLKGAKDKEYLFEGKVKVLKRIK